MARAWLVYTNERTREMGNKFTKSRKTRSARNNGRNSKRKNSKKQVVEPDPEDQPDRDIPAVVVEPDPAGKDQAAVVVEPDPVHQPDPVDRLEREDSVEPELVAIEDSEPELLPVEEPELLPMEEPEEEEDESDPLSLTISLKPSLITEHTPRVKEKDITLPRYPRTGLDVKLAIQQEFQIPVCLQTLTLQSLELTDSQLMERIHLRAGDTLTVSYTTQGNLTEVQEIIDTMKNMCTLLKKVSDELIKGDLSPSTLSLLNREIHPNSMEDLIQVNFTQSTPELTKVNHVYFVRNSGVALTVRLHKLLTRIPWQRMPLILQFLERWNLRIMWILSCTIGVRCLLSQYPTLVKQLSKSVLRENILPDKVVKAVTDCRANAAVSQYQLNDIAIKTMFKGMGVISNLAELEQYRLAIVNTPHLIDQMTSAMLSPSYPIICTHIVLATLVCISYSRETHSQLAQPLTVERILRACNRYKFVIPIHRVREADIIMMNYFGTIFFALVSGNSSFAACQNHDLTEVVSLMQRFLQKTTYTKVHEAEVETRYFWSTIRPLLCLVYRPPLTTDSTIPLQHELFLASVRAGILSIQNVYLSDDFKDIVEKEGLVDYLTCLPWYVTEELKEEANVLIQLVNNKIRPHPPRLVNIAKGYLAINCGFTLEEVMSPSFIDTIHQKLLA